MKRFLCLFIIVVAACDEEPNGPPPIAQGVALSSQDNTAWSRRLNERFLRGTSLAEITTALVAEGFVVAPEASSADFNRSRFPCGHYLSVAWQETDGKVVTLTGTYGTACT